jgi:hypothetical protein
VTFTDYLMKYEMRKQVLNYFRMSVSSIDELHRRLKESFQRRTNKMKKCIQRVEMLAVAIR